MQTSRILLGAVLALLVGACSGQALTFTIGECVNLPGGDLVQEVESVDCDTAHDGEVFALPQFPSEEDAVFPGELALIEFGEERCIGAFPDYVGTAYETSVLFSTQLVPTAESWDGAGDREVVCLLVGEPVEDADGVVVQPIMFQQLTGAKQGSGE